MTDTDSKPDRKSHNGRPFLDGLWVYCVLVPAVSFGLGIPLAYFDSPFVIAIAGIVLSSAFSVLLNELLNRLTGLDT